MSIESQIEALVTGAQELKGELDSLPSISLQQVGGINGKLDDLSSKLDQIMAAVAAIPNNPIQPGPGNSIDLGPVESEITALSASVGTIADGIARVLAIVTDLQTQIEGSPAPQA